MDNDLRITLLFEEIAAVDIQTLRVSFFGECQGQAKLRCFSMQRHELATRDGPPIAWASGKSRFPDIL
jgi:hypothetical protein